MNAALLLFEDADVARLNPATWTRPAYAVSCAGWRLVDLAAALTDRLLFRVRPHLSQLESIRRRSFVHAVGGRLAARQPLLAINARLAPTVACRRRLEMLVDEQWPTFVCDGDVCLAVWFPTGITVPLDSVGSSCQWEEILRDAQATCDHAPVQSAEQPNLALELIKRPHDIVRLHLAHINETLIELAGGPRYRQASPGLFVADNVKIAQYVAIDTGPGNVIIESNTTIGPHTFLRGPLWIGGDSRINEHSSIKDGVMLGHTTRVGGEIEGSIIEPFSNKQHHGFLGHSYIGSWVNLGAGTSTSDLKNTYGTIRVDYDSEKIDTGMQFLGAIIGDFAKTAINTSVYTGKIVGLGSALYGEVATNVPSFVNYASGTMTSFPLAMMLMTQRRMLARRNVEPTAADQACLAAVFEMTHATRASLEDRPPVF